MYIIKCNILSFVIVSLIHYTLLYPWKGTPVAHRYIMHLFYKKVCASISTHAYIVWVFLVTFQSTCMYVHCINYITKKLCSYLKLLYIYVGFLVFINCAIFNYICFSLWLLMNNNVYYSLTGKVFIIYHLYTALLLLVNMLYSM